MCSVSKVFHREKFSLGAIFVGENGRREKLAKLKKNSQSFRNFARALFPIIPCFSAMAFHNLMSVFAHLLLKTAALKLFGKLLKIMGRIANFSL